MNEFYIYVYMDPRKPGEYKYGPLIFLYEPFYIGKGKGYRDGVYNEKGVFTRRKIDSIENKGSKVIIVRICKDMSENDAFHMESVLIRLIGRYNLGRGVLTNLTDGGEGSTGRKFLCTEAHKEKISKKLKGRKLSSETKGRMSNGRRGEKHHKYWKGRKVPLYLIRRRSEGLKKAWKSGKMKGRLGKKDSGETRLKKTESAKKAWIFRKFKILVAQQEIGG